MHKEAFSCEWEAASRIGKTGQRSDAGIDGIA